MKKIVYVMVALSMPHLEASGMSRLAGGQRKDSAPSFAAAVAPAQKAQGVIVRQPQPATEPTRHEVVAQQVVNQALTPIINLASNFEATSLDYQSRFDGNAAAYITARQDHAKKMKTTHEAVKNRHQKMPYCRDCEEQAALKALFAPVIQELNAFSAKSRGVTPEKVDQENVSSIKRVFKTKSNKSVTVKTTDQATISAKIKQSEDPYATETESLRTVASCGQSIIEGTLVSTMDHTYVPAGSTTEEKKAILEYKRQAEFTAVLTTLEGFGKAREAETRAQAQVTELGATIDRLSAILDNPKISEKDRIPTERELLSAQRKLAGALGQLAGAHNDRAIKNNAIAIARMESGSVKSLFSLVGGQTANYNTQDNTTSLTVDELFNRILPAVAKKDAVQKALGLLDLITGKTKTPVRRLTWTGQKSVKITNFPVCHYVAGEKKSNLLLVEPLTPGTKYTDHPVITSTQDKMIEAYRMRAGLIQQPEALIRIRTLDELHGKAKTRIPHWVSEFKEKPSRREWTRHEGSSEKPQETTDLTALDEADFAEVKKA